MISLDVRADAADIRVVAISLEFLLDVCIEPKILEASGLLEGCGRSSSEKLSSQNSKELFHKGCIRYTSILLLLVLSGKHQSF